MVCPHQQTNDDEEGKSFCLAALLESKSVDPSQVWIVHDNARLPSEFLMESISSLSQAQGRGQDDIGYDGDHVSQPVAQPRNSIPMPSSKGMLHHGVTAPFKFPCISFDSALVDGSSTGSSCCSSNPSDDDIDEVLHILDQSLDILDHEPPTTFVSRNFNGQIQRAYLFSTDTLP